MAFFRKNYTIGREEVTGGLLLFWAPLCPQFEYSDVGFRVLVVISGLSVGQGWRL
jgi:hypothetical protein